MAKVTDLKQHKKNKVDQAFLNSYHKAGLKVRNITEEEAKNMGIRIESKPGDVMGRIVHEPLAKASRHLEKETERGEHSPKIAGHETKEHGGQLSHIKQGE